MGGGGGGGGPGGCSPFPFKSKNCLSCDLKSAAATIAAPKFILFNLLSCGGVRLLAEAAKTHTGVLLLQSFVCGTIGALILSLAALFGVGVAMFRRGRSKSANLSPLKPRSIARIVAFLPVAARAVGVGHYR